MILLICHIAQSSNLQSKKEKTDHLTLLCLIRNLSKMSLFTFKMCFLATNICKLTTFIPEYDIWWDFQSININTVLRLPLFHKYALIYRKNINKKRQRNTSTCQSVTTVFLRREFLRHILVYKLLKGTSELSVISLTLPHWCGVHSYICF